MDNKSSVEQVYHRHHSKKGRMGKSVFKDTRGDFLRDRIGINKKVLDIGCRDGVLTEQYCKQNNVLGVDIDTEALSILENRLNIKTKYMDLNGEWNTPVNFFNAVVAGEVLEHLYYPEVVIKKAARSLKSDGILLGSVPNAFSLKNRFRLLFGNKKNTPLADPTHINHFTRRELETILKKHFKEVSILPLGRYTFLDNIFPGYFSFMLLFEAKNKK